MLVAVHLLTLAGIVGLRSAETNSVDVHKAMRPRTKPEILFVVYYVKENEIVSSTRTYSIQFRIQYDHKAIINMLNSALL